MTREAAEPGDLREICDDVSSRQYVVLTVTPSDSAACVLKTSDSPPHRITGWSLGALERKSSCVARGEQS